MIPNDDDYYASDDYRHAVDSAMSEASLYGNKRFDDRFVSALRSRRLRLAVIDELPESGKPWPIMAPKPYNDGGYEYPSYVVRME